MKMLVLVASGGAIGAMARYLLTEWFNGALSWRFLPGTLIVNILGCFFIGVLFAWLSQKPGIDEHLRVFIGVGVLGALTTFSAFSLETLQYVQQGAISIALLNIGLSVILGLFAVWSGFYLLQLMIW